MKKPIRIFCVNLWLVCFAVCACLSVEAPRAVINQPPELDLQAAATAALGQREGAIVIVDPQTGHLRAVVNPNIAFGTAFPPGSAIKPFTALAALRSGVIAPDTRLRCREKYKREDVVDSCSHPPNLAPFSPAEALAYSCNYYFATVGERLEEESVRSTLAEFGFGQITGIDAENESAGALARGRWQPESAVGEGGFLQVTPIQFAMAYAALFNGGRLFRPALDADLGARGGHGVPPLQRSPQIREQLRINDKDRAVLLAGMRGAVEIGTAAKAELNSLPSFIVGKTGTSTPLQGFRPQGWFAGLAFANTKAEPADAQLVVVVYLKNAHGSEAAEVARSIFAAFAGVPESKKSSAYVTVNKVSENTTHKMSLEDYILQVVSTEASVEDQPEALKALAIAARTYALKNIGRHGEQGYDFCSTSHCQRFEPAQARPAVAAAVRETAGLVLRDDRDQIIDSYYSASCGGMTANLKTLWGADEPDYLRGVQDSYCNSGAHYRWTDVITSAALVKALRSDPRTDVGETIRAVSVAKQDATGRAELLSLVGDRAHTISGWEFKLIVGRALGWQWLKSSRFTVSRSGSGFVFRGGGFGHGLGLCQEGSHVMAQRGQSFHQILAHYFPGTTLGMTGGLGDTETGRREDRESITPSPRPRFSPSQLSASHFRLIYPKTTDKREAEQVLSLLESNRTELLRRVSAAGIQVQFPKLEIVINETTGDFVGRTGMPSWAAAASKNNRMELQPLALLKQRRILETTLRHELVHVLVDSIGGGQTPRWIAEGMAIHLAGEGKLMDQGQQRSSMSVASVEKALASAGSAGEMKTAYAAAYNLVRKLIKVEGEQKVWKRIADRSYSVKEAVVPGLELCA